jgi:NADH:ubiquinone oxidoreductase subunit 6 (subunit J)
MSGLIEWIIFLPLAVIAIVTAAGMIITMSMYRAGLALMASFVALAGIFILLDADLLAAIQVMMNVGGMLAMVLFMVMIMMDPGGEMMWGMKRDMHMRGPGAFSMHMPSGSPPPEDEPQESQLQGNTSQTYTCSMHPEIQQDHLGTCPKCGMTLIPRKNLEQSHQHIDMNGHEMSDHDMSQMKTPENSTDGQSMNMSNHQMVAMDMGDKKVSSHDMGSMDTGGMKMSDHTMSGHDMGNMDMDGMDMGGMTPRQNYDMMVDMAMSTAQLPWAIVLGIVSAVVLIVLLILTPWPTTATLPTQDASRVVGELLLSRYMIAFEGAALLILAGIAGAVLLAKRESASLAQPHIEQPEKGENDKRIYTCPMHSEVQQQGPGTCPKCGMTLVPAPETVATESQKGGQL